MGSMGLTYMTLHYKEKALMNWWRISPHMIHHMILLLTWRLQRIRLQSFRSLGSSTLLCGSIFFQEGWSHLPDRVEEQTTSMVDTIPLLCCSAKTGSPRQRFLPQIGVRSHQNSGLRLGLSEQITCSMMSRTYFEAFFISLSLSLYI